MPDTEPEVLNIAITSASFGDHGGRLSPDGSSTFAKGPLGRGALRIEALNSSSYEVLAW